MNALNRSCVFVLAMLLTAALAAAAADTGSGRPNIVLVFIDDMGWADFSCFGNSEAATPNVDALAAEGLRFHQFYVNSPICSPSRVAVSTGQYPHRHRITSYLAHRRENARRGMVDWLDPAAPMLARFLQSAGYATGHFGKWHMGGQRDVADAPPITAYGFDESLTNFEGMGAKLLPLTERRDKTGAVVQGRIWEDAERLGEPASWMLRSKITGGFVEPALRFIDKAQRAGKPFYINLWPDDVHGPWLPSVARWSENRRERYLAVLEEMDRQLAPLFDRVKNDRLLRENTMILLCSDNGHEEGAGCAGEFRGCKATLFEGGVRSPLIVWAPGLIAPERRGQINRHSVFCAMDLVPSLLRLAGVSVPAEVKFDGEELAATLTGGSEASRRAPIHFRRPPDRRSFGGYKNLPDMAVREGPWKLLCDLDGGSPQLYNLDDDPGESRNLAGEYPELTQRLQRSVAQWNDGMPEDAVAEQSRSAGHRPLPPGMFVNPVYEGADPCVVKDGSRYLRCATEGDRGIAIWASDGIESAGRRHTIWTAPASGPISREVWAPELIRHADRWYVYFAASDGRNENHRTYVLASQSADPLGAYSLHGPLYTGDNFAAGTDNLWAIDMTLLVHQAKLYALWSGWPDRTTDLQHLYIAPMESPVKISGSRVRLCDNDTYLWERTEEHAQSRGLHEGPQPLQRGGRTFLIYSCGASWLPTYKLGMLELKGENPLDPASWIKFDKPVFAGTPQTFGVGHGTFTLSPDETEWWHLYHAKMDERPGWRRGVFIQRMHWSPEGLPLFGAPVPPGKPLALPGGTSRKQLSEPVTWNFAEPAVLDRLDYYGHHLCFRQSASGIELALPLPQPPPATHYESGEKFIMRDSVFSDFDMTCRLTFLGGRRDAGVLFRVTAPSVGYDAQRGYFAGMVSSRSSAILGKMDGKEWHHLKEVKVHFDPAREQTLRVRARGSKIEVFAAGSAVPQIVFEDGDYAHGAVGCRSVSSHALFHSLDIKPL